ncbi:HDOD domain-containing protein [Candidatus Sumerlaeota bacterium]|nr:HDOD domain-containing protein [Candidatus Sumerlaeota bacterium]
MAISHSPLPIVPSLWQSCTDGGGELFGDVAVPPSEESLIKIVKTLNGLPSLPDVVYRVMELVHDPDSTVPQIVETLLMDQAMTAKILRVANSAYYGFVREISTVTQAVAVLGKNDIADHVISSALCGFLNTQGPGLFDRRALWEYSLACAQCTRILLRLSSQPNERAYICALLHDIGQLVIDEVFPQEHDRVLSLAQEKGWPIECAERKVLGVDHAFVGGMVALHWNFPPVLVDAIGNHHATTDHLQAGSTELQLRCLLDLSDRIVRAAGIGMNHDHTTPEIPEEMWFPLGLNATHREKVTNALSVAMGKLSGLILT